MHSRDAGGTAHEDDFVDVAFFEAGGLQGAHAWLDAALDEGVHQLLKLRTAQAAHQVLGHAVHGHDVREVDLGAGGAGELNFRLLSRFLQALERHRVLAQVEAAVFAFELVHEPFDDGLVEVVAAKVGVSIGGEHFEDAVAQLKDAHVVGAASEVKHHNLLVCRLLVEAVRQRRRSGLVDDALHLESGDLARLLGGLTLAVVEVRRDRDDRAGHFLTEVLFCRALHFLKGHGRDFLRGVLAVVDGHPWRVVVALDHLVGHAACFLLHFAEARAHEALDAGNGLGGVGDGLTLRRFTHFALTTVDEGHHRRGGALAFTVVDDHRFVAFHHCHAAVGCPEVNANDFAHVEKLEWLILTSPDQIRCQPHFPVPSVPS